MVEKAYLSLFQLRSYKAWLDRDKTEFMADNPKPKKDNPKYSAKIEWYLTEHKEIDRWISSKEAQQVRTEMEVKAKKFLYPQPVMLTGDGRRSKFKTWQYKVEDFFNGIFR